MSSWLFQVWSPLNTIGGNGGTPFQFVGNTGVFVKGVKIWRNFDGLQTLCGIQVDFTDGSQQKKGYLKGGTQELQLNTGERISTMKLWDNGGNNRTGRIVMFTNQGQTLDWGQNTGGQGGTQTNIGSGILIGFVGAAGNEIDRLAGVFIQPVQRLFIDNISYPSFDFNNPSTLSLQTLQTLEGLYSGQPYTFRFNGSKAMATATDWSTSITGEVALETSFVAGVPIITESGIKLGFKLGGSRSWSGSNADTITMQWGTEHVINGPNDAVKCTAVVYEGDNQDIAWVGKYNLLLPDGTRVDFPVSGTLKQVSFSQVIVTVEKLAGASKGEVRTISDAGTTDAGTDANITDTGETDAGKPNA